MKKFTLVAAQLNFLVGDIEGNTRKIINTIEEAKQNHQADLVVFPELAITGYPPEDLLFRDALYQRISQALETLCASTDITIIVGCPEKINHHYYNNAIVIQQGKIIARYSKRNLPNHTVFDEKRYFSSGSDTGIIKVGGINLGIVICEDTWHKQPMQATKNVGANLIISLNASPFSLNKPEARQRMLAQQSKALGLPIMYLNTVGGQDELVFDGGSMVYDQYGQRAQQAAYYQEDLMRIELDADNLSILSSDAVKTAQTKEASIYQALVSGVRDYVKKNGFSGVLIGLSGGVDSALTLAIACDAVGSQAVEAVMMPSRYTSEISKTDARAQALTLGCRYSIIDIDPVFEAFNHALSESFKGYAPDTTEENLQARCRGTALMALSNKKGHVVLTTGNKSEMAVGYATLYGDMAGGFAVLKDVYKTQVYRLCEYRNKLSPVIPQRVLQRPPTAELAEGQQDQDSLPPYPTLDAILQRFIEQEEDAVQIAAAGFDITLVKKIIRLVNRNEYKRRQAPIGIRLSEKAFGKDRRYPITSGY